jgi:hypothetical protein
MEGSLDVHPALSELSPFYLYLDQRDLIDCANSRDPGLCARLRYLVESRRVQIVLSFVHAIETWKYRGAAGRRAVAATVDALNPVWLLNRDYLFQEEARTVSYQHLGFSVPISWSPVPLGQQVATVGERNGSFCPYRSSVLQSFSQSRRAGSDESPNSSLSFADVLDTMDQESTIAPMLEKLAVGYAQSQPSSRSTRAPISGLDNFVSYVFYEAFADMSDDAAQFMSRLAKVVEMSRCPALYTYVKVRQSIHKDALSHPDASEMEDVAHLVALPYVDAFSTDKRIADYIRRAGIVPDAFPAGRVRSMRVFRLLAPAIDWLEAVE